MDDDEAGQVPGAGMAERQCAACAHFIGTAESGRPTGRCRAFDEIPEAIWNGQVRHDRAYPGDRGVQFKSWK